MNYNNVSIILLLVVALSMAAPQNGSGGSKCPNTSCTPAPVGTTCTAAYNRDDGCCPVWTCANGQSVYGNQLTCKNIHFGH